jgi:enoyl-CoA hydratase
MEVETVKQGPVTTIVLNRPEVKNAVDRKTADQLADAFRAFEKDPEAYAGVLWGAGGCFCAGADLGAVASADPERVHRLETDMSQDGPMGPSRLMLTKPVIAAVSGFAVAGGLELACWCDLRVAEEDAVFGVYSRRYGVPLMDGGTVRLPRLIGLSRALDMILTGRSVSAPEALEMGLANYVAPPGRAREEAEALAARIAKFPQKCVRSDRLAAITGMDLPFRRAMEREFKAGLDVIFSGETLEGAGRFVAGKDRERP